MSVVRDIFRTYRHPEEMVRHRIGVDQSEGRALITLMLGCLLVFIAQWPRLARVAYEEGSDLQMLLGASLMGWLFIMPLIFYLISVILTGLHRLFRGKAPGYEIRVALFWGLLAASPMWLMSGIFSGFLGKTELTSIIEATALAAALVFWAVGLNEVMRRKGARDEL